jgi:hypothetical protein
MEGVVFAPYYGVLLNDIRDDRPIIDGCFGKNGHYPPRPEDEEYEDWNTMIIRKINEASIEIEKATRKK